jgi:DHA2 family multidrug resistance protein
MPIAGRLYNRVGPRTMVGAGLLFSGIATLMMSRFTLDTSYLGLVMPQVWQGLAFSLIFVSLSTSALALVPRPRMTNAAALYNLVRQIGGSFGIAIFATMLESRQQAVSSRLMGHLDPLNPAFVQRYQTISQALAMRGVNPASAGQKTMALLNGLVQQQAAVMSFQYAFFLIGALFIVTLPLVLLLRSRKHAIPTAPVP